MNFLTTTRYITNLFRFSFKNPVKYDKRTYPLKGSLGTPGGLPSPWGSYNSLSSFPTSLSAGDETDSVQLHLLSCPSYSKEPTSILHANSVSCSRSNTTFVILKANQCGVSKIVTPLETERIEWWLLGAKGKGDGELLFKRVSKVSVLQDEHVLGSAMYALWQKCSWVVHFKVC